MYNFFDFSLSSIFKKFKKTIFLLIFFYLINEALLNLSPYLLSKFLKNVELFYNGNISIRNVYFCNLLNTIFWSCRVLFSKQVKIKSGIFLNQIEIYIKTNVFNFIHNISYEDFLKISGEKAFTYLRNLEYSIKEIYRILIIEIIANIFSILVSVIILFCIFPPLGFLLFFWIFFYGFLLRLFFKKILFLNKSLFETKSHMTKSILETFSNVLMIKINNSTEYEENILKKNTIKYQQCCKEFFIKTENFNTIISILIEIFLWGFGTFLLIERLYYVSIPISTITYIIMIVYSIVSRLKNMGDTICHLFECIGEYNNTYALLNSFSIKQEENKNFFLLEKKKIPLIEFKNVYLKYNNMIILKKINFQIFNEEKVCFIGSSGSGKSTIINLICGLIKNYEGEIFINGEEIRNISIKSIMNYISIISQNSFLFSRTVEENIKQNNNISKENLIKFCKMAEIHKMINQLPKKYQSKISNKNLSGGEIQRIILARMFVRNKKIKIFDEATNGLDNITKKKLLHTILNLISKENTDTLIFIDHSLEFLNKMNKIFFVKNGEIVFKGNYEEIKKENFFINFSKNEFIE